MEISGHTALVTGGASGLGEAVAIELARLGA
ncbi:MAG TPA: 3-hydroxyacyl-CoA dehydrogenase, partial [Rubrivivax sp.]|nr:3-hydroxyacyl-CoA dehydrogenase [Rubrivivax sp.]